MTQLSPEIRDVLAAEYVLGTQSSRVRRRLRKLIDVDPELAERVAWWESHLGELALTVPATSVPPAVWSRIERELNTAIEKGPSWWSNLFLWRSATMAAGALVLVLAVLLFTVSRQSELLTDGVILVLTDENANAALLVSRTSVGAPIRAQPVNLPALTDAQVYQLWLLPSGDAPVSMGLLNDQQDTELALDALLSEQIQPGLAMAVSLEPAGGSPTGAPTGPILFTGNILSL